MGAQRQSTPGSRGGILGNTWVSAMDASSFFCPTASIVFTGNNLFTFFFEAARVFFRSAFETSPGSTTHVVYARNSELFAFFLYSLQSYQSNDPQIRCFYVRVFARALARFFWNW